MERGKNQLQIIEKQFFKPYLMSWDLSRAIRLEKWWRTVMEFLNFVRMPKINTFSCFFPTFHLNAIFSGSLFYNVSYGWEALFNPRLSPPYRFSTHSPPHQHEPSWYYHGKVSSLEITGPLLTNPSSQTFPWYYVFRTMQRRQRQEGQKEREREREKKITVVAMYT